MKVNVTKNFAVVFFFFNQDRAFLANSNTEVLLLALLITNKTVMRAKGLG